MKITKTIKWIAFSVLAVLILGWIFVPIVVKNYAINNSKELLGRQIDIEGLRLNFFTGNLHMTGFTMFEQDDVTEFVSFDTLNVNIEPYQFVFNKKVVEQFYLQGLSVKVIQRDSTFNFDDLIAFHTAGSDTIEEEEDPKPFKYILSNLELKDADFTFEDQNIPHTTNIEDFSFFIPYISWDQEEKSNADLKFNFKRGGYLESSINVNPVDGQYDARIVVDQLFLDPFLVRMQEYAEISSVEGFINSQLDFTGNINEPEKSLMSGRVEVRNFAMSDWEAKKFLSGEKIICTLKEIDVNNDSYHLDSIRLTKPFLFFEMDSISNNIFRIFKLDSLESEPEEPNGASDSAQDSVSGSGLFYAIDHLALESGVVDYTDNITGQPFNYHLSEIQIETDSIYSDSDWVKIDAQMLLNDRGTLKAQVGFDPVDYLDGALNISVEKFLLPDLNIYTNHFVGHTMVEGDMFYYSDSKLVNGNIESENRLIIKQPNVNNTKGGIFTLPLKFALWLLSDENGDVNLNVPVRGDLNDPEIDVWKLVWSTFRNKITDTANDPVQSLAPLVGADPKELQAIEFEYTDSLPSVENKQQLDWLLELEKKKEGLSIDLEYFVDDELQRNALLSAKEDGDKEKSKDTTASATHELSELYSNARLRNVRKYLDSISSDTRIQLKDRDSMAPNNTGAVPYFKINFSLLNQTDSIPD